MNGDRSKRRPPTHTKPAPKVCQKCGKDCEGHALFAVAMASDLRDRGKAAMRWLCAECFTARVNEVAGDAEEEP